MLIFLSIAIILIFMVLPVLTIIFAVHYKKANQLKGKLAKLKKIRFTITGMLIGICLGIVLYKIMPIIGYVLYFASVLGCGLKGLQLSQKK